MTKIIIIIIMWIFFLSIICAVIGLIRDVMNIKLLSFVVWGGGGGVSMQIAILWFLQFRVSKALLPPPFWKAR